MTNSYFKHSESAMGYELNAQLDDTSEYVKAVQEYEFYDKLLFFF